MEQTINKFSWRRVAATWRFYSPGMATQCAISAGVAAAAYGLALLGSFTELSMGLFTLASFLVTFTAYCGPLHFARFRDKTFTTQLPATAGERTVVTTAWSIVVIPAIIVATWFGCMGIAAIFTDNYDVSSIFLNVALSDAKEFDPIFDMAGSSPLIIQRLQDLVPISVCLYVVVCSRRSPIIHGVLAIICTLIAMGFLGGIYGIISAFSAGLSDAVAGQEFDPDRFTREFSEGLSTMIYVTAVFSVCVCAIIIGMIYRKMGLRKI